MKRPPLHPACKIFPALGEAELQELVDDIADLVVDPFCGAGSTLAAAMQQGRECLGFDSSRKYVRMAQERLSMADMARRNGRGKEMVRR